VVSHQERKNLLQRPAGGGNVRVMKSIAANVDQVMLVVAGTYSVLLFFLLDGLCLSLDLLLPTCIL
jgi:hypothetical protein